MNENENIIVEITKLTDSLAEIELDEYCLFMKETILSLSGLN